MDGIVWQGGGDVRKKIKDGGRTENGSPPWKCNNSFFQNVLNDDVCC